MRIALSLLLLPLSACFALLAKKEPTRAEQCKAHLEQAEVTYCAPGQPRDPRRRPDVDALIGTYPHDCHDAPQPELIARLESCREEYVAAEEAAMTPEDRLRREYYEEATAVVRDPRYKPLLEEWRSERRHMELRRDLAEKHKHDRTGRLHRQGFEKSEKKAAVLAGKIREIIREHGIDPQHAEVLGLLDENEPVR
jgi:hypothetical protein